MGTTRGPMSDEGPEIKNLHGTFSEPQKRRPSSATHSLFFKRLRFGNSRPTLHVPTLPACSFEDRDGFLCPVSTVVRCMVPSKVTFQGISRCPVSSLGHSVVSLYLLVDILGSRQRCLQGTYWSREAGSPSCGVNHQGADLKAFQG